MTFLRPSFFGTRSFRDDCSAVVRVTCCLLVTTMIGCDDKPATSIATSAENAAIEEQVDEEQVDEEQADEEQATAEQTVEDQQDVEKESNVASDSNKVLRHAVFFSFKDDSSKEDVQSVADAFAALPSKIDAILDFQWGTNNSPENFDDGFTHCFLLSFKDEAARDAYIPHPAHKGEFADVLRPHMKDVFVIDYWGRQPDNEIEKELKHAVFFKFKDDASAEAVKNVEDAFAALPSKIDSIKAFEWGKNNSPENNDDGFTHCFMVTFDSEEGREQYLPHPDHKAFVEILMPVLDQVRVLDFWEQ